MPFCETENRRIGESATASPSPRVSVSPSLRLSTSPRQLHLPIRGADVHLPTCPYGAARALLGVDERGIAEMIEDGRLAWAWNIAARASQRPEIRVLSKCLTAAQREEVFEVDLETVVGLLFGRERPWIWGTEFTRAFNCVSNHTLNLILEKTLRTLPDTDWRPGPGGSPCITWASAVRFVEERRIT